MVSIICILWLYSSFVYSFLLSIVEACVFRINVKYIYIYYIHLSIDKEKNVESV